MRLHSFPYWSVNFLLTVRYYKAVKVYANLWSCYRKDWPASVSDINTWIWEAPYHMTPEVDWWSRFVTAQLTVVLGRSMFGVHVNTQGIYNQKSSKIITYRNIPIKGATLIKAPPIVWESQQLQKMDKIAITFLIIVRFSIQNHRWKAGNLSFNTELSDMTLL